MFAELAGREPPGPWKVVESDRQDWQGNQGQESGKGTSQCVQQNGVIDIDLQGYFGHCDSEF